MLAAIPKLFQAHKSRAQNLKYIDILLAHILVDFQRNLDLRSFWKHECSPLPLEHLQTTGLRMETSVLTEEGQALNGDP